MMKKDHTWDLLMDKLKDIEGQIREIRDNHLAHIYADIASVRAQLDVIQGERRGIAVSWQFALSILGIALAAWGLVKAVQVVVLKQP